MKFYSGKRNPNIIVWDGARGKMLCRFVGGEYETTDTRITAALIAQGFEHDADTIPFAEPTEEKIDAGKIDYASMDYQDMVKLAAERGYDATKGRKKEQLIAFLEG